MARGGGASLERLLDKERSNVTGNEGAIVVEKRMPLFSGWKAPSVGWTTFSKRVLIPDSRIWRLHFHTASVESSLMRGAGFGRLLPFAKRILVAILAGHRMQKWAISDITVSIFLAC